MENGTEDDLRNLDGMVNFRLSEILPSGMVPLDNSLHFSNDSDELSVDNSFVPTIYESPQKYTQANDTEQVELILSLIEMALRERGPLTVVQICECINLQSKETSYSTIDSNVSCSQRNGKRPLNQQRSVENLLNSHPQFVRISEVAREDSWTLLHFQDKQQPKADMSHSNHWKKKKIAEYTNTLAPSMDKHTDSLICEGSVQEEPLNLVIKPQEEPLNLSMRPPSSVGPTRECNEVNYNHRKEGKVTKKIFSKTTSRSRHSFLRLKKSKKKALGSLLKGSLRRKHLTKRNKKEESRDFSSEEMEKTGQNLTPNCLLNKTDDKQGTKIKLIKVGDSYKIASNKDTSESGTNCGSNNEVQISSTSGNSSITQNENKCKDESINKIQIKDSENTAHNLGENVLPQQVKQFSGPHHTESLTDFMGVDGNVFLKPSPLQQVQIVTVAKGKSQDGMTLERKPVMIQVPTTSGGAKILLVPQNLPFQNEASSAATYQPLINQTNREPRNTGVCHNKPGFPQVNDSNRKRKVFKIGEDGTISCLGTLEQVQKSGLFINKHENSNKPIETKDALTTQPPKSAESVMKDRRPITEHRGNTCATVKDLSKLPQLLPVRSLTPVVPQNNAMIRISQVIKSQKQTTRTQENRGNVKVQSNLSNRVGERSANVLQEKSVSLLNITPKAPTKQTKLDVTNTSFKCASNVPRNENKVVVNWNNFSRKNLDSVKSERSKSSDTELEKIDRVENTMKIRSKLRSKIKESYYSSNLQKGKTSKSRGSRSFRPPFYPVYPLQEEIPRERFPSGPGLTYYYPPAWPTGHQYPGSFFGYNPRTIPYEYPHTPRSSQPKQDNSQPFFRTGTPDEERTKKGDRPGINAERIDKGSTDGASTRTSPDIKINA